MSERAVLSPPGERTPRPVGPARTGGSRGLRSAAVAATAATFLLIGIGALVRATGSGLGCPGWPKCFGRWIPPLHYHAVIEYSHRLATAVDTVLVVVLAAVAAVRYRWARRVVWASVAAVALIVLQAALGALVVKGELETVLVTAHFMNAMVLAGTLVYATVAAFTIGTRLAPVDRLARLARVAAASVFALLAVGAYVRGEGAGLAFSDWPLMDGRIIPALSELRPALHFAHRSLAAAAFVLAVGLAVRAWRERRTRTAAAALAVTAAGLFAAQILIGAASVWSRLAPAAVTAHVLVAGLIWGAMVATATVARVESSGR
jgi:cytochrome c oxidase assembly protein subunit 15